MPLTSKQIETQLAVLERRLKGLNEGSKEWYALSGKIKKMRNLLIETKKFEYLAQ